MDVSVELRVAPARQSATFLDEQVKSLRADLESAQARLSKFQQNKGIVVTDERLDQENARFNMLISPAGVRPGRAGRNGRRASATPAPRLRPTSSAAARCKGLKSQLAQAETKLSEISSIVGKNHPQRLQLDAQIAELKQQIAAETRRVAGGTSTLSRGSSQKVDELQAMVDQQKQQLLSLRSDRDQIAVYLRDVEAAQRAYDAVSQRLGQVNMEGQNNQANTRLLSPAVEPLEPSRPKVMVGIVGSILGALAVGILAALGLELLDRRIRRPEDLMVMPGVPVIGVLQPAGSQAGRSSVACS